MARIRTVKPEFFTSLTVAGLSVEARLTFIGLWTHVDDQGRCVDDPRLIKAAVWPLDDRISSDVEQDLRELAQSALILRYRVGDRLYLCVPSWDEHQKINRPTRSKFPPPPANPGPPSGDSLSPHGALSESSREPGSAPRESSTRAHVDPSNGSEAKNGSEQGQSGIGNAVARENLNSVSPHAQLTEGSLAERNREQGTGNREKSPPTPRAARQPPDPPADHDGEPGQAETLVAEWMNSCHRRPPRRVIEDLGRLVLEMLADGTDPGDIRRGIEIWQAKGSNPRTLPSFVNQVMNARPTNVLALPDRRPSTTDQRVGAALELAAKYAQEDLA